MTTRIRAQVNLIYSPRVANAKEHITWLYESWNMFQLCNQEKLPSKFEESSNTEASKTDVVYRGAWNDPTKSKYYGMKMGPDLSEDEEEDDDFGDLSATGISSFSHPKSCKFREYPKKENETRVDLQAIFKPSPNEEPSKRSTKTRRRVNRTNEW